MALTKKEIANMYETMKNSQWFFGLKDEVMRQSTAFMKPEYDLKTTVSMVYSFFREDDKQIYEAGEAFWILALFALKSAALYYNCHVEEMDQEILRVLKNDLISYYKDQFGQDNYEGLCDTMWDIFEYDPQLFLCISQSERDRIRTAHSSSHEIYRDIENKLFLHVRNTDSFVNGVYSFIKEYLMLVKPIMERSMADYILIIYMLAYRCMQWRVKSQEVEQLIIPLIQDKELEKNRLFFNENDYQCLMQIEE